MAYNNGYIENARIFIVFGNALKALIIDDTVPLPRSITTDQRYNSLRLFSPVIIPKSTKWVLDLSREVPLVMKFETAVDVPFLADGLCLSGSHLHSGGWNTFSRRLFTFGSHHRINLAVRWARDFPERIYSR